MPLVQQQTVDDSTILVSHTDQLYSPEFLEKMADFLQQKQLASTQDQVRRNQYHSQHPTNPLTRRNDPRLDSAICMPSARKSTACYESAAKSRGDCLERWTDDLLKEFDNVMLMNLNTDPNQDNNQRVQELIKQIDGRLSKTLTDNIEGFREFVREKKIDCELLLKSASQESHTLQGDSDDDGDDETFEVSSGSSREDETQLIDQGADKTKVSDTESKKTPTKKFTKFLKKATSPITRNFHRITPREKNTDPIIENKIEDLTKKRIEKARLKVGKQTGTIGSVVKRSKTERLLNGRYLIDKKDVIGEGHHGKVFRGVDLGTDTRVAVKCLKKQFKCSVGRLQIANRKQKKKNAEIIHEGRMMLQMEDLPSIVPLLDLVETPQKVYYIMPLANKDLSDVVYRRRMTERCARDLMRPIFEAVKGLHDSGYIHRDIKPENIMLYQGGFAKLGDFGLSTEFGYHSGLQVVGTPAFAAPEVLGQFHRTEKFAWLNYKRADIWSLGATLYVCLAGRYPFDDSKPMSDQLSSGIQFPENRFQHYSAHAADLIQRLMIVDPLKRISIDEALNHPFFTGS